MTGDALQPYVHVITPGDHFSPETGSAVPTVVDGLSRAGGPDASPAMAVIAKGTYEQRYCSATVVEFDAKPHLSKFQTIMDVAFGRVGFGRPFARREWAAALASQHEWQPSVIFSHNGPQLIPAVDTDRHRGVLYAHNQLLQSYTPRETGAALSKASLIVCVSDFLANETNRHLPTQLRDRIRVVANGVDCARFHPATERTRGDRLEILFVGRTITQKGPDVLIKALSRLDRVDFRLRVVGSYGFDPRAPLSEYEITLRRLSAKLADAVTFIPTVPRDQVPALMRSADVLIVPSRWDEPFGLTVLEGMATGIPVVASAVGGIPQAMGDAGVKVPPDDPAALAEALFFLATDELERLRIGAACRKHALAHDWNWSRDLLDKAILATG